MIDVVDGVHFPSLLERTHILNILSGSLSSHERVGDLVWRLELVEVQVGWLPRVFGQVEAFVDMSV